MSLYQDHEGMRRGPSPTVTYAEHPYDEKRRLEARNGEHLPAGHITDREDYADDCAREERIERERAWDEGTS